MPRGIPKDPNHPRNKKHPSNAGAAPKRRGRPPGSKNVKSVTKEMSASELPQKIRNTVKTVALSMISDKVAAIQPSFDLEHKIQIVRNNVSVLSLAAGQGEYLREQVELLMKLTKEALYDEDQEKVVDNDDESSDFTASAPVAQTAALPSFVPPPPFPQ